MNHTRRKWVPYVAGMFGFVTGMVDYFFARLLGLDISADGTDVTFWVAFFFALNFAALGVVIGHLWLRKKELGEKQQQLLKTQAQLVEHEKLAAIGRVAASVAHEVRNPLGVIKSSAGLIEEDAEGRRDTQVAARYIANEVDRLDTFVAELLTFAKPFGAMTQAQPLQPWIESLAVFEQAGRVHVSAPDTNLSADFSPVLLTQLVHTLVENAEYYSGSVTVDVTCDSNLAIRVYDDGDPIPDDVVPELFEPFFTTRAKGTGLGLATAKKIAEAHGGSIRYQPNPKAFVFEMGL